MEKLMTLDQQEQLLSFTRVGLEWIAGRTSFERVSRSFGQALQRHESDQRIDYTYSLDGVMRVTFSFDKLHAINGQPRISEFRIKVEDVTYDVQTDIPLERIDALGLHRIVHGESIDGVRIEHSSFFTPNGIIDPSGFYPDNYVSFGYRLPLPPSSPFDIYAGFYYLGEWMKPTREGGANLDNLRAAVNLRSLVISRHYIEGTSNQQRESSLKAATNPNRAL